MSDEPLEQSGIQKNRQAAKQDAVRFNLYLPHDSYLALEELQQLSGKKSLAETIRCALKLYHVVQEGIEDGKEVMLYDKKSNEREKLISL